MKNFNDLKARLQELRTKIRLQTATAEETKEHDEIVKKIIAMSPAKLGDIWPKGAV